MRNAKLYVAISILVSCIGLSETRAQAQTTESRPTQTVRGKISALSGQEIKVATASGDVIVRLSEATKFVTEMPINLSDIKSGLYLGTTAQKQPDGTFRASEVHVFADHERGLSEGHKPSSSAPNSTMTNANVERVENVMVQDVRGPMMTLKYNGGEVKVFVAPNTPITQRVVGDRSSLKVGADVSVSASQSADGALRASQVTIRNRGE